jgi:soluble lytic murein transglycosylase-like protein
LSLGSTTLLALALGSTPVTEDGSPGRAVLCTRLYAAEIAAAVRDVERVWTVPPALVRAILQAESGFQPQALSSAGAVGLMQVLPANAQRLGVPPDQLWEPGPNILAGARLLAVLLRHYRGDVVSALVAYNARPRKRLAPVPENGETAEYVRQVLASWRVAERCGSVSKALTPSATGPG